MLRTMPVATRPMDLRKGLLQFNAQLYSKMLGNVRLGEILDTDEPDEDQLALTCQAAELEIVRQWALATANSIHCPMTERNPRGRLSKILRACVDESDVLPSKERCPFLLILEVLCTSHEPDSRDVFTDGKTFGVSLQDCILGRVPVNLLRQGAQCVFSITHPPLTTSYCRCPK
jgi:hypothetical protein